MRKSGTQTVRASGFVHRVFGVGTGAGNALPIGMLTLAALLLAVATFLGVFAVVQAQKTMAP